MNYQNWKRRGYKVPKLLLDSENPRLPPDTVASQQRDLIAELVYHDDVLSLAKNIALHGYFPNEAPIIVIENGEPIVIEGNRRVAACKLLLSPEAGPVEDIAKFQALANLADLAEIRRIEVIVAPSREAAIPIIVARHTDVQIARWKPLMKAAFYAGQLLPGQSLADSAKALKLAPSELAEYVRMHNFYRVICTLQFAENDDQMVRNPRTFPATTLQRVYETPEARAWLGFEFDENGDLIGKIDPTEFKKGLTRVTQAIVRDEANSRSWNHPKQVVDFLHSLPVKESPNLKKRGTFNVESLTAESKNTAQAIQIPSKPKGKKTPSFKTKGLIPAAVQCLLNNRRVQEIVHELRTLNIGDYPNSAAGALRTLIEVSLRLYLKRNGQMKVLHNVALTKATAAGKKIAGDWDSLHNILVYISKSEVAMPDPQLRKAAAKLGGNHLFDLNQFTHNESFIPDETELRRVWAVSEELMRFVWQ